MPRGMPAVSVSDSCPLLWLYALQTHEIIRAVDSDYELIQRGFEVRYLPRAQH